MPQPMKGSRRSWAGRPRVAARRATAAARDLAARSNFERRPRETRSTDAGICSRVPFGAARQKARPCALASTSGKQKILDLYATGGLRKDYDYKRARTGT